MSEAPSPKVCARVVPLIIAMASTGSTTLEWYAFGSEKEEIEVLAATYLNAEIARAKKSLILEAGDRETSRYAYLRAAAYALWCFPDAFEPTSTQRGNARRLCSSARQFAEHALVAFYYHGANISASSCHAGVVAARKLRKETRFANHAPLSRSRNELPKDDPVTVVLAESLDIAAQLVPVVSTALLGIPLAAFPSPSLAAAWRLDTDKSVHDFLAAMDSLRSLCIAARDAFDVLRVRLGVEKHGLVPPGGIADTFFNDIPLLVD